MPIDKKGTVKGCIVDTRWVWEQLLRTATPDGWRAVRVDEVVEPGPIPEQYKRLLKTANVAVFDITFQNPNVFYELGMREVAVPGQRVLVAAAGTDLPFNIQTERVLFYEGAISDPQTVADFRTKLARAILAASGTSHLRGVRAPSKTRLEAQLRRAGTTTALVSVWERWSRYTELPADLLIELATQLSNRHRIDKAVDVLRRAYTDWPEEYDVARTYGWYLRKNGEYTEAETLLRHALSLNPSDTEAMGMLAGLYKRQGLTHARDGQRRRAQQLFDEAEGLYQTAISIDRRDVYNLLNFAFMAMLCDSRSMEISKQRYRAVLDVLGAQNVVDSAWDMVALGQAHLVVGAVEQAIDAYSAAVDLPGWSNEVLSSEVEQLRYLSSAGVATASCDRVLSEGLGVEREPRVSAVSSHRRDVILLHLSDLHFGTKPKGGAELPMHRFRRRGQYGRSLIDHVEREYRRLRTQHDQAEFVVVLSGDIAYQSQRHEYHDALSFLAKLCQLPGIAKERVIIVPGNHDVNWGLARHDHRHRFDEYLKFIRKFYGKEHFSTWYPHIQWGEFGDEPPRSSEIFSFHDLSQLGIVVTGFNSCVLEDDQKHFGLVGSEQIEFARNSLNRTSANLVRIAVMHHHVLPVERTFLRGDDGAWLDRSIVRDFGLVEHKLHELGYDLLLHGHKHEPAVRESTLVSAFQGNQPRKSLLVMGAGSVSVEASELPQSRGNHMGIYRVHHGMRAKGIPFVDVEWRELPYNDVESWKTTGLWQIEG
jgi:tetratricopeptide (TPR) repeat protein